MKGTEAEGFTSGKDKRRHQELAQEAFEDRDMSENGAAPFSGPVPADNPMDLG